MLSPTHLGLTETFGNLLMLVWPKFAHLDPARTWLPLKFHVSSDKLLHHQVCKSWLQKHQKRSQNRENNGIVLFFLETKCCHSNDNLLMSAENLVTFSVFVMLICFVLPKELCKTDFRRVIFEFSESFRMFYDFKCLQFDSIHSKTFSCENISLFPVWSKNGSIEVKR